VISPIWTKLCSLINDNPRISFNVQIPKKYFNKYQHLLLSIRTWFSQYGRNCVVWLMVTHVFKDCGAYIHLGRWSSWFLQSFGIHLQNHRMSQSTRPEYELRRILSVEFIYFHIYTSCLPESILHDYTNTSPGVQDDHPSSYVISSSDVVSTDHDPANQKTIRGSLFSYLQFSFKQHIHQVLLI
jgi:hypothetical protein